MPTSFTYMDALNASRLQSRRELQPQLEEYVTNMAVARMWSMADWRFAMSDITPFWLEPGRQDYGDLTESTSSTFGSIREAYVVMPNGDSPVWSPNIATNRLLEQTHHPGVPDAICYRETKRSLRVHPRPGPGMAAPNYMIVGTYKRRPGRVPRADLNLATPFEDNYFFTLTSVFAWATLLNAGDRKAAMEQDQISRQLLFEAAGEVQRDAGEETVHPSESLMHSYGGGFEIVR